MKENKLLTIILNAVAIIISVVMLYPFFWMFFSSFKTNYEIMKYPLSILPKTWTVAGYQSVMQMNGYSLAHFFANSLIIALGTTFVVVVSTSLGGYALFRKRNLPGFSIIEKGFMVSVMYPAVLLLIPLFSIVVNFKLYGTGNFLGIILASSTGAWGAALPFFLFRNFFASVPYAIMEAATIDGASEFVLLRKIMMPLMYPVFATAILISFLINWGSWLPILMLSQDMSTYNMAAMLVNLNSELGVDLSKTAALSNILTLPVIAVFILTQKRVMDGIASGGVKG